MILDYRAFDTLGESFVLFTATCAVLLLLEQTSGKKDREKEKKKESFLYTHDPIVCTVVKLLIPVIMIFGVYILFNGHLSPGGGFSGGAILGAGFIGLEAAESLAIRGLEVSVVELSERSVNARSRPVEFPDYTRGGWKNAKPFSVEEIDMSKFDFSDGVKKDADALTA